MFKESTAARTVDVDGTIKLSLTTITGSSQFRLRLEVLDIASGIISPVNISPLYTSADSGDKTITVNETVSLAIGESLVIYAFTYLRFPEQVKYNILSTEITVKETILTAATTTIDAFPIYETGERLAQHIMDTQYPFYSEYFGRLDSAYNLAGDFYLSENQLRFMSFASGLNIRGATIGADNNPLTLSWDTWFKAVNSMYNIGYTFETIDDFYRIRVEEYAFFFVDSEVLDISSRICVYDIESEVMPELAYLSVKSGYKTAEYLATNGRGEYNTNSQRTSMLNTDAEFDNISPVRADTKGIIDLINASVDTTGSTDEKADNQMFAIKTQRNTTVGATDWDAETNENIAVENDSSLFGDTGLNLYITPTRMLRRMGSRLKVALMKYLSSYLRFQTADKLQTLETTGEGYTTVENDDILVNDLTAPIYRPIKHRVEVMLTWADIELIQANPLQRITFSSSITGWILNIKKKNNEDKGVIEIIEKYVS